MQSTEVQAQKTEVNILKAINFIILYHVPHMIFLDTASVV